MDTVFDITVTHTKTVSGYMHAQGAAITGTNVVMLKDKAIKKLLLPLISMQHCIMSFNPEELRND